MKEIKVEWCENFIRAAFTKHHAFPGPNAGIERNLLFKMAEAAGLYEQGTYGSPMSKAIGNLCKCETVLNDKGEFAYHCFKMK
jgi:hypothetical protein